MNETERDEDTGEGPSFAKPVDDPNLPVEGDPEEFDETPVDDDDISTSVDVDDMQGPEEPNDLSGIEKEFDDDDDESEEPLINAPEEPDSEAETPEEGFGEPTDEDAPATSHEYPKDPATFDDPETADDDEAEETPADSPPVEQTLPVEDPDSPEGS